MIMKIMKGKMRTMRMVMGTKILTMMIVQTVTIKILTMMGMRIVTDGLIIDISVSVPMYRRLSWAKGPGNLNAARLLAAHS
jgi:hypothetical protein